MKQIRSSKFSKFLAYYLAIMMFLQVTQPLQMYALTSGPTQPEFNAFTPIGTSDMVDLASGDFNYNIPIMDVGGYPINLAYNSGVTMDQEASWVGLGWNLNVGQISRQVRGLPDDFRGDQMLYHNNLRDNFTIGTNFNFSPAFFGKDFPFALGLGVQYNNYEGITWKPSIGVSFSLSEQTQVGFDLSGSTTEGATLKPSVKISGKKENSDKSFTSFSGSIGAEFNSRKGLEKLSISGSKTREKSYYGGLGFRFNNTHNYTPTNRVAYTNTNKTFNASLGGEIFGGEAQMRVTGFGSYQTINHEYRDRYVGAYGYENSQYKNGLEGVLDFNRQNEQAISKNTNALAVTNYTYDVYNIEGQGVSGMFRPFRSQVSYVYNDNVTDASNSQSFGAELGVGNLIHGGLSFKDSPTRATTGLWDNKNHSLSILKESNTDSNSLKYEPTTFKLIGELNVDPNVNIFKQRIKEGRPSRIKLDGGWFNTQAYPEYIYKDYVSNTNGAVYASNSIATKIKRDKRFLRNQNVQKISASEAENDFLVEKNQHAKAHHNAGMKILKEDGNTYVFGKAVYNIKKIEATFDVSGRSGDNVSGLVSYNGSVSGNHSAYSDKYENVITTPEYAHTYLLTSILSTDYEDLDNNGISDNDLGSYTKFDYTKQGEANYISNYKWRTPYTTEANKAYYNEGLKTSRKDQKGSYIYGEKEVTYLKKIETKTHVAFFDLQDRKDAMGVNGQNGGRGTTAALKSIKSIRLYSKSELIRDGAGKVIDPGVSSSIKPIKAAHFEYTYDLCPNIPSNSGAAETDANGNQINLKKGKLTLKKVYFTYRNSNMGKYTPYVFDYNEDNAISNPDYGIKDFDIWGNYKKNDNTLSTSEYPFVEQDLTEANNNTASWTLRSVKLPSGGTISIQTESDDYKYVQNKKAMQMFKVVGAGKNPQPTNYYNNNLYTLATGHNNYIYVKIGDTGMTNQEFLTKYLSENLDEVIYFKFLLNMTSSNSDYVSGYFELDTEILNQFQPSNSDIVNSSGIASIPLRMVSREGGPLIGNPTNPIARAGWGFGRTYLNRAVYSLGGDEVNNDFMSIVYDLVGSIRSMASIFKHPNKELEDNLCAQHFDNQKSWIRLENPDGKKLGGGLRVKTIQLSDNWDVMNDESANPIYNEMYGQEYSYSLDDNTSSGVATFEPNASNENPLVKPFYGQDGNYADRISAPKEMNYVEEPFGQDFFPSPRVTYSKVTVMNLDKTGQNGSKIIKKHATGKVVTEHFTSFDFPTIVDYTNLDMHRSDFDSPILQLLDVASFHHLVASQGFSIETNDMNGKIRSQKVYAENDAKNPLSQIEYKYNIDSNSKLNNYFTTIDEKGNIDRNSLMGIDYDVINDFNESNSVTEVYGFDGNLAAFIAGFWPSFVPKVLPVYSYNEYILRTATTTSVVNRKAVLVEKIAYDLGSRVATKNLAWDATSGQVILTETTNEFDDKYYSFSYPAYWYYKSMGMASDNIDLISTLILNQSNNTFSIEGLPTSAPDNDIKKYLKIGDELVLGNGEKLWVYEYVNNSSVKLMNRNGDLITNANLPNSLKFKITRSGNKNMQIASMASVTSMKNPIASGTTQINDATFDYNDVNNTPNKIINASAVEYSDLWNSQCENGLPNELGLINGQGNPVNPFLYNIRGEWRAVKSFAYLTGRNNFMTANTRKAGFFDKYNGFYKVNLTTRLWSIDSTNWTFASKVTRFSPYGAELENKDVLERYSAAQYGYQYTLPMAVTSNSRYQEMGFDNFEDYNSFTNASLLQPHFGFSQALKPGVTVTNQKSHTGHKSLKVEAGKKATFKRKIDGCKQDTVVNTSNRVKLETKTSTK